MSQLYSNFALPENFVERDVTPLFNGNAQQQRQTAQTLIDDYTGETTVLIRGLKIDADLKFLQEVSFPQIWEFKKMPASLIEKRALPARADPWTQKLCKLVFDDDWGKEAYFEEQLKLINMKVRDFLARMLDGFQLRKKGLIWRFAETRVENLHFDNDKECDTTESFRLYYNIDSIPRIWRTTTPFSQLARTCYRSLDLARFKDEAISAKPSADMLNEISVRAFGGWQNRGRETFPCHTILFEPGDMWLTDGRTVPHQVLFGRRVVSTFFDVENNGLPPGYRTFKSKCVELHQEMSAANTDSGLDKDAPQFPIYPRKGAPTKYPHDENLKEMWDQYYTESVANKLVKM